MHKLLVRTIVWLGLWIAVVLGFQESALLQPTTANQNVASITGVVMDSVGDPLQKVLVRLHQEGRYLDSAVTDSSGAYRFYDVLQDTVQLRFIPFRRYHLVNGPLVYSSTLAVEPETESTFNIVLPREYIRRVSGLDSLSLINLVDSVVSEIKELPELGSLPYRRVEGNVLVEDLNGDGASDVGAYATSDSTYYFIGCLSEGDRYRCVTSRQELCFGYRDSWFPWRQREELSCSSELVQPWDCPWGQSWKEFGELEVTYRLSYECGPFVPGGFLGRIRAVSGTWCLSASRLWACQPIE